MIELVNGQHIHVFECNAGHCRGKGKNARFVRRNLSTADATSTSNLQKHATLCWGKEVVDAAKAAGSALEAREVLKKKDGLRDGSIAVEFARVGQGKPTFSTRPPTKLESRALSKKSRGIIYPWTLCLPSPLQEGDPYPSSWVRVLEGKGGGSLFLPEGYPCRTLMHIFTCF